MAAFAPACSCQARRRARAAEGGGGVRGRRRRCSCRRAGWTWCSGAWSGRTPAPPTAARSPPPSPPTHSASTAPTSTASTAQFPTTASPSPALIPAPSSLPSADAVEPHIIDGPGAELARVDHEQRAANSALTIGGRWVCVWLGRAGRGRREGGSMPAACAPPSARPKPLFTAAALRQANPSPSCPTRHHPASAIAQESDGN